MLNQIISIYNIYRPALILSKECTKIVPHSRLLGIAVADREQVYNTIPALKKAAIWGERQN